MSQINQTNLRFSDSSIDHIHKFAAFKAVSSKKKNLN